MPRDRELMFLEASVLIPINLWEDLWAEDDGLRFLTSEKINVYKGELDFFAFAPAKDYAGFRSFLKRNSALFGNRYEILERMTDEEIEHILRRTRECRVDFALYEIDH